MNQLLFMTKIKTNPNKKIHKEFYFSIITFL